MLVYMFPGQGSQFKGMGQELLELFPEEAAEASKILGYDIKELCLNDHNNFLVETEYTQPAIYFISCLSFLRETNHRKNNIPNFICGHSLGEYAALFASGAFDLFTGLEIVKKRGNLMGSIKNGGMLAVIGKDVLKVKSIMEESGITEIDVANYNTFEQIALSGIKEEIMKIKVILEEKGFKCILLNVSAAFHSRFMEPIRIDFMRYLTQFDFSEPKIHIISSTTGLIMEKNYILENLGFQLVRSVNWVNTILYLKELSVLSYIELEPGKVLTNLTTKILNAGKEIT